MKKFIYILMLIALGWLIKLSYDFYVISQQLNEIRLMLYKSEQKNASLNDQLVAVQRQADPSLATKSKQATMFDEHQSAQQISPSTVIKKQLELIQFALQQQQWIYALELLSQTDQSLDSYELADGVRDSLHQTIAQDIKNIQQFVIDQNTQQDHLERLIAQVDQSLMAELKHNQLQPSQTQTGHFWEKWFKVDRLSTDEIGLSNRRYILKETQLRLLLAQQLLIKGQNTGYGVILDQAIQQLDLLPDANSQDIRKQLIKIQQTTGPALPILTSVAILGGQK